MEKKTKPLSLPSPKREWRLKKIARLLAFGLAASTCVGLLAARSVYGDAKSSAMSLGHELGKMGDVGTKRPLRLNGESIFVASTTEDIPLKDVLDRMEATCRANSAGMPAELETLSESLKKKLPEHAQGGRGQGVIREERVGSGMVACFARAEGQNPDGVAGLLSRVTDLLETGDLQKIGRLRYVFAETTRSGKTHIVAAWTDGPFNVYKLAPDQGDAPGSDAPNAPRPPRSVRLLSADVEGVPYGVRIYDSEAPPSEVIALYDTEMKDRGWEAVLGVPGDQADRRAFNRQGVDLLIFADRDGDRTMVSVIEMRGK